MQHINLIPNPPPPSSNIANDDNITDWALRKFQEKYGVSVSKDDIWHYIYGVMHAKDWRKKYKHDLQRELPRIPLAINFRAFIEGGSKLMALHINYETCPEADIDCLVNNRLIKDGRFEKPGLIPDEPDSLKDAFKIKRKMKLKTNSSGNYDLQINNVCSLVNIPKEIEEYTISGRSPLKWAVDVLCVNQKKVKETGAVDDPNSWYIWDNDPFELVRHLRRLIYISLQSRQIINNFPPALDQNEEVL